MIHCEPYKSCSLFGAMRYFSNLKNSISLINGPSGCTFYVNNAIVRLNGYFNAKERVDIPRIFCIDFNEKDAIMGSEKKLLLAAEELIERYNPELLLLFNCCVSEIIGSDVDDVADTLQEKYEEMIIIPIHTAGFKGDHKYGMRLASDLLMQYVFNDNGERCEEKNTVNILGEFDYFNRSSLELCRILSEIGIDKIGFIPGKASVAELRSSKNAELNIISCQNASRHLAELMEAKYGIPWIGKPNSLYGVNNSYAFYKDIYSFFGMDSYKLDTMKWNTFERLEKYKKELDGKTAVIASGSRRALGYAEILKELGVKIELIFSEGEDDFLSRTDFLQYSQTVMYNEYANELSKKIDELNVDFVFTTLPEIVAPIKYLQRPEIDYAGMEGALRMGEFLLDVLKSKDNKIIVND